MRISKLLVGLAISMASLVAISNFLVQFPVKYLGLENILTYAAFTYPITFLITDLANRKYGKFIARKVVYLGFLTGILLTLFFSTNFDDFISIRIAFLIAQLLDVKVFDVLRKKSWYIAPITSSIIGSVVDTFLFFFISFYDTAVPWISLAVGDFFVKLIISSLMLIPFRLLLSKTIPDGKKLSAKLY